MLIYKNINKWQIIEIKWIDSAHGHGWKYEDNVDLDDKYLNQISVGYFFKETKKAITIVQSKSNDGDDKANIDAVMTIPKIAIQKIKKI